MQVITVDKPMWIKHGKMERHFNVRWSRTKQQYAIEKEKKWSKETSMENRIVHVKHTHILVGKRKNAND